MAALLSTFAMSLCAADPLDPTRLGKDLTPLGGEAAGNKDGSIPAWIGSEAATSGWSFGKKRLDYWKYKADKPLFSIDASNVDKYADRLSPGQVELAKQIHGFRMDVYPSRRTCGAPAFVAANTKKNVGFSKLAANGWSLQEATVPGVPFPAPSNGVEAMWNAKMRYRGVGVDFKNVTTAVSPRKGSEEWIKANSEQTIFYPWGVKGSNLLSKLPAVEQNVYFTYTSPTALAGQSLAVTFPLEQQAEVFYYFPGQRRVRRMPTYAYDSPQIGMENQYLVDEPYVFNGLIDRFDWKLLGKKEIYVPYNVFGAYDFAANFDDVAKKDAIEPGHRRYELHRVWVVEATVKPGTRHVAPKRLFYIDEDSWNLLLANDYDGQGKLWKVREGYNIPVYETGTCDVLAFSQYNIPEGRYVLDGHAIGTGSDVRWLTEPGESPRMKSAFYTSDNLRSISER